MKQRSFIHPELVNFLKTIDQLYIIIITLYIINNYITNYRKWVVSVLRRHHLDEQLRHKLRSAGWVFSY